MSTIRLNQQNSKSAEIPFYFRIEGKVDEGTFEEQLDKYWDKLALWNIADIYRFQAKQKLLAQAWNDYALVYDLIQKGMLIEEQEDIKLVDIDKFYLIRFKRFNNYQQIVPGIYYVLLYYYEKYKENEQTNIKISKDQIKSIIDLPFYEDVYPIGCNTSLLVSISCSYSSAASKLIDLGADVNKYSLKYGSTPLLLSIAKGWNHQNTDVTPNKDALYPQRAIIKKLLAVEKLDINAQYLVNGMTALHIACLRGDNPELIKLLLDRGSDITIRDHKGLTPIDYLKFNFSVAQKTIENLMDNNKFGRAFGAGKRYLPNQSYVATLPSEKERSKNQAIIKSMLHACKGQQNTQNVSSKQQLDKNNKQSDLMHKKPIPTFHERHKSKIRKGALALGITGFTVGLVIFLTVPVVGQVIGTYLIYKGLVVTACGLGGAASGAIIGATGGAIAGILSNDSIDNKQKNNYQDQKFNADKPSMSPQLSNTKSSHSQMKSIGGTVPHAPDELDNVKQNGDNNTFSIVASQEINNEINHDYQYTLK